MKRSEKARSIFGNNANCAQSVLLAFAAEQGIDDETALRIATGFGGGMGRMANVCGAVTGAFMALGLTGGMRTLEDSKQKSATYERVREFSRRFTEKYGSIYCRDLLGIDISTTEGHDAAAKQNLFKTKCPEFVGGAVEMLESMLSEKAGA